MEPALTFHVGIGQRAQHASFMSSTAGGNDVKATGTCPSMVGATACPGYRAAEGKVEAAEEVELLTDQVRWRSNAW